jgi:hypothetical protein
MTSTQQRDGDQLASSVALTNRGGGWRRRDGGLEPTDVIDSLPRPGTRSTGA